MLAFVELQGWSGAYLEDRLIEPGHDAEFAERLGADPLRFWSDNRRGTVDVYNENLFRLEPAVNGYDPLQIAAVRRTLSGPVRGQRYLRAIRESDIPERNPRGHLFMKRSFWLAKAAVLAPLPLREELFPPTQFVFLRDLPPDAPSPSVPVVEFARVPRLPYSEDVEIRELAIPPAQPLARDEVGRDVRRYELPAVERLPLHGVLEIAYASSAGGELAAFFEQTGSLRWVPGLRRGPAAGEAPDRWLRIPLPDASTLGIRLETHSAPGSNLQLRALRLVSDRADEDHRIHVVARSADEVTVDLVGLPEPRVLVFLDAYHPGWEALVDGKRSSLLLAQDAFKAVVVPAGDHRVVFRFASPTLRAGLAVSGAAWIVSLALVSGVGWTRRTRAATSPGSGPADRLEP